MSCSCTERSFWHDLSAAKPSQPTGYVKHCIMGNICVQRIFLCSYLLMRMCLTSWSETVKLSDAPIAREGKIKRSNQKNIMAGIKGARRSSLLVWKELRSPYQCMSLSKQPIIWYFYLMSIILWRSSFPPDSFELNNPKLQMKVSFPARNELHTIMLWNSLCIKPWHARHVCMYVHCVQLISILHPAERFGLYVLNVKSIL